jgi:hypothetical protein
MPDRGGITESGRPWADLQKRIERSDAAGAAEALADFSLEDQKLVMSHLPTEEQALLMEIFSCR